MTTALTWDLMLQGLAIMVALVFAAVMSWRARKAHPLQFTTFLLQAMVCEAALIVIASLVYPDLFASVVNERAFVVIIAMMTLIYAVRDIIGSVHRQNSGPEEKTESRKQPI